MKRRLTKLAFCNIWGNSPDSFILGPVVGADRAGPGGHQKSLWLFDNVLT